MPKAESVLDGVATQMPVGSNVVLEAPSEGAILAPHSFAPLSLLPHRLRTVLAAKGSLRRAQQRRALDRSGPF